MILFLLCAALAFRPVGIVVFGTIFGSTYRKVGETVVTTDGRKTETLAIYKAGKKPFLIVGPCVFHEIDWDGRHERKDFFFVRPDKVIRTNTDQGGDIWFRLPRLLIIDDDLTSEDRVRTPYWDDLKKPKASVRYDEATASYVYSLWINEPEESVTFAIPAKFFTPDLVNTTEGLPF